MFTQCPACSTVYRLRLDQLRAARGQVRCSRCDTIFDALDHRVRQQTPAPAQQAPQDDHAAEAVALTDAATILSATALAETPAETPIDTESRPAIEASIEACDVEDGESPDDRQPVTSDAETIASPAEDSQAASRLPEKHDLADTSETSTSPIDADKPIEGFPRGLDLSDAPETSTSPIEADEPIEDFPRGLDLSDAPEESTSPIDADEPIEDFPRGLDLSDTSETIANAPEDNDAAEHLLEELGLANSMDTTTSAIDADEASGRSPDELELTDTSETIASALDDDDAIEHLLEELDLDLANSLETTTNAIDANETSGRSPGELDLTDTSETIANAIDDDGGTEHLLEELELDLSNSVDTTPSAIGADEASGSRPDDRELSDTSETISSTLDEAADKQPNDSELNAISEQTPISSHEEIAGHDSSLEAIPLDGADNETLSLRDEGDTSPLPDHLNDALQTIDWDSTDPTNDEKMPGAATAETFLALDDANWDDGFISEEESTLSAKLETSQHGEPEVQQAVFSGALVQGETDAAWPELLEEPEPEPDLTPEASSSTRHPDTDLLEEDFASLWNHALDKDEDSDLLDNELEPESYHEPASETATTKMDIEQTPSTPASDGSNDWNDFSEQHIESLLTPGDGIDLDDIDLHSEPVPPMPTELSRPGEDLDLDSFDSALDAHLDLLELDLPDEEQAPAVHQSRDADEALLKQLLPEEDDGLELDVPTAQTAAPMSTANITEATGDASSPPREAHHGGYRLDPEERSPSDRGIIGGLLWPSSILLMLAILVGQFAYYHHSSLATYPQLRPLLSQLCHFTECELPPQRDLSQIRLASHLVQFHPRHQDSLLITATLFNRADFAQPFPDVALLMTDLQQQVVASRRFSPQEYLVGQRSDGLMPQNVEIPLMLEVLDPGREVVGFRFEFY